MKFVHSRIWTYFFGVYTGSKSTKTAEFKKNPLKLIPAKSTTRKTAKKPNSFPTLTFHVVKLIQIPPLTLPKVLRRENVPILETRELQRFQPIENRLVSRGAHKDIQTISHGNDEKHFSHVLSMAGAPHVNTNLSLSLANGLNHSCDITYTPRQIISPAASSLDLPDVFAPREQGPGTILVLTQTLGAKSLTRTVLTLSPSQLSSMFLKLRNMQPSLACVEHNHQKLKQMLFLAMNASQRMCQERSKLLPQVMFQTSVSSEIFSPGAQRVPSIPIIFAPLKSSAQSSPQMLPPEVFSEQFSPAAILPTAKQTVLRKTLMLSMLNAPLKSSKLPVIFQLLPSTKTLSPARQKVQRNRLIVSMVIAPPQPSPLSLPVPKPSPQPPVVFGRELAETSPVGHKLQRNTLQLSVVIAPPQLSPLQLRNPQQSLRPVMFGPLSLAETLSPVGRKVQRNKLQLSVETVPPQLSLSSLPVPKPSPKSPVVFGALSPSEILPLDRKRVQRKPLQLSLVTIPPHLFHLPLPAPSSTLGEILPHRQSTDFYHSKKVEINDDDVPKNNLAFETSM